MQAFKGRRKPEYTGKNLPEQRTNKTQPKYNDA